jgi:hypothetical protein
MVCYNFLAPFIFIQWGSEKGFATSMSFQPLIFFEGISLDTGVERWVVHF